MACDAMPSTSCCDDQSPTGKCQSPYEANKCLRFMKETVKNYVFTLRSHGPLNQVRIGLYCDAAWSVRPDGSSQGGMLMFLASHEEMESNQPFPLTIFDWSSKKLTRMCRSSLSAEAQAATIAVDELEWAKVFFAAAINPYVAIQEDSTMLMLSESPVITDAKALFDSTISVTPGLKLSERRTAIEICILRERMAAAGCKVKWVNSKQQLADGLTKPSAKDDLAYMLSRGVHALRHDPHFTAAKKVTHDVKMKEEQEYEKAAEDLFEGQAFMVEDEQEKEKKGLCKLPGCMKEKNREKEGNAYCSRRHYYLHQFRMGNRSDEWRKAATCAITLLAMESIPEAEGAATNEADDLMIYRCSTRCWSFVCFHCWACLELFG